MKNQASDFDVGETVKTYDGGKRGTVIGNRLSDGDQVVAVEWADGSLTKANIDDLKRVNSALEADFDDIQMKCKEASRHLKEANLLAKKHGQTLRELQYDEDGEEQIDVSDLFLQICGTGWSRSSMNC